MTYQYQGPSHYWNHYSLVPREQYYYGYYGTYGPHTDLSMYEPIGESNSITGNKIESFIGSSNYSFFNIVVCIVLAWIFLKLFGIL